MTKRTAPTGVARAFLSVVVPCFDEESVVRETHRRLVATLDTIPGLDFELVYVDDGSRDATLIHSTRHRQLPSHGPQSGGRLLGLRLGGVHRALVMDAAHPGADPAARRTPSFRCDVSRGEA